MIGKVKWYDVQKGYGFITPVGSGPDIFVHRSGISWGGSASRSGSKSKSQTHTPTHTPTPTLQPGDEVTYKTQLPTPNGTTTAKPCAVDVTVTKPAPLRTVVRTEMNWEHITRPERPVRRGGSFTHANDKPDLW